MDEFQEALLEKLERIAGSLENLDKAFCEAGTGNMLGWMVEVGKALDKANWAKAGCTYSDWLEGSHLLKK